MRRAKKVIVEAIDSDFPAHADGEMLCYNGKNLAVELIPAGLEIISS
jgi:hypothetical protein